MINNRCAVWGESHIGYKKDKNEDRFLIQEMSDFLVLAVADGLGGCPGGEVAAQHVIDAFRHANYSKEYLENNLKDALLEAERQIFSTSETDPKMYGMGSTATTVIVHKNLATWIHVGDSRIYVLRKNKIKQITKDHTFLQDFIDDGTISIEEAKTHRLKNMLDQCVGCSEIEPDQGILNIETNDRLLLCSDGLTTHLDDNQIKNILSTPSIQKACLQLIEEALRKGGTDNITVIIKSF